MDYSIFEQLSQRESQVMKVVYREGEASAEQIRSHLPDPPSNSAIRSTLRSLEEKGFLTHWEKGRTYIYRPSTSKDEARRSVLQSAMETFFSGSVPDAVATLLDLSDEDLSELERKRLLELIDQTKKEGR